jgi:hypothetical protein
VLVGLLVVLAFVPLSSVDLAAQPDSAPDYAATVKRFDAIAAEEERLGVFDKCRSRLLQHGKHTNVSVVLVHGLTNCPEQWVEFAETLHAQGANVLILRMPHHGLANADGTAVGSVSNLTALTGLELRDYADTAADRALGRRGICVAELVAWDVAISRLAGLGRRGTVLTIGINVVLGIVLIGLKLIVH